MFVRLERGYVDGSFGGVVVCRYSAVDECVWYIDYCV